MEGEDEEWVTVIVCLSSTRQFQCAHPLTRTCGENTPERLVSPKLVPATNSQVLDRMMSGLRPLGARAEFKMAPIYCPMRSSWDSLRRSRISSSKLTLYDRQLDARRPVFWEEGCIKLVGGVSSDPFYDCASFYDSIDQATVDADLPSPLVLPTPRPLPSSRTFTTFRHHFIGQR